MMPEQIMIFFGSSNISTAINYIVAKAKPIILLQYAT
jgi:hypothetical protein